MPQRVVGAAVGFVGFGLGSDFAVAAASAVAAPHLVSSRRCSPTLTPTGVQPQCRGGRRRQQGSERPGRKTND